MNTKIIAAVILFGVLLFSCRRETVILPPEEGDTGFLHGTFVINEGSFLSNNASITHISTESVTTADAYFDANGFPIGDLLQSFAVRDETGYAVLNNSAKVEVFNLKTFEHMATITGADYPRYILPLSDTKAYLTNGSLGGEVKVIDLENNTITGTIIVGNGPEGLVSFGTKVFVCNSGGWSIDNTVSVIDTNSDALVATIDVGDRPQQAVTDIEGNLWVLCSGEVLYDLDWNVIGHTPAEMFKIDAVTYDVVDSQQIGVEGDHPIRIAINANRDVVYYENNGIYSANVFDDDLEGNLLIGGVHYGFGVKWENGEIWTTGATDFVSNSVIRRHSALGVELEEFEAGIGANGFVFN